MNGQYQTAITDLTTNDDGRRPHPPRLLVVHTFEGNPDITAAAMADYQSGRMAHQRTGSYHVVIDGRGVSCRENDDEFIPWAAGFNGNRVGLHVSLAGRAAFTRDQWLTRRPQLEELGRWLAHSAAFHSIPLEVASIDGIRTNGRGVCSHADISRAWPLRQFPRTGTDHTDPGAGFPWDTVLELARGGTPPPPPANVSPPGPVPDDPEFHRVTAGDTLGKLATRYRRTVAELAAWNCLDNPDHIVIGDKLRVAPR